jgi:hypothetical protein
MNDPEYAFQLDADLVTPSAYAGGPWDPSVQHGGAAAALIARVSERLAGAAPMRVARMTISFLRPVPIAPLAIRSRVVREGRSVQILEVSLFAGETHVVHASILKVRITALSLPASAVLRPLRLPLPEDCPGPQGPRFNNPFLTGITMRVAAGTFLSPGPAAVWFRLNRPIVEAEQTSALMRAAATADFSSGTSSVLDLRDWSYKNADLTVSLVREPVGEWILLDAESWVAPVGGGIAFANLADREGYFGHAVQSLVVQPLTACP